MTREILGREAARLNTDAACFQCTQNSAPKVFGAGRTGNKACVPLFGRDAVEGVAIRFVRLRGASPYQRHAK